jgi:L-asparaginase
MNRKLPNIKILATGGTIAGRGSSSTQMTGYAPGTIGVQVLIDAVPEIKLFVNVSGEQIANISSSAMTNDIWLMLARRINELLATDEVDGIVITHGTSTIEETAYFLNLVVKSNKPVVITGAMKPATALSADGPGNILDAVCVAGSSHAKGKGVLVVLNGQINGARDVTKTNTTSVETFKAPGLGCLGYVQDGKPYFYRDSRRKHTFQSEFDLSTLVDLPKVYIIYGHVHNDGVLVDAAVAAGADGIVHAGTGMGIVFPVTRDALFDAQKKGVVVVKSSRVGSGMVTRTADDDQTRFVAADTLNPQKARILLTLALTKTSDPSEVQRIFDEY